MAAYQEPRWARMLAVGPAASSPGRRRGGAAGRRPSSALSLGILLLGRAQRETEAQRQAGRASRARWPRSCRGEASAQAEALRRRDYINRVNLAYREFLDDNAALAEQILYGCPLDLRNWEWSHVQRLAHLELDTFVERRPGPAHHDVWSLAFSPDGRRLVSGSGPWFQPHAGRDRRRWWSARWRSGREIFAQRGMTGRRAGRGLQPRRQARRGGGPEPPTP